MECYKEIAEIASKEDEKNVRETLVEVYGKMPEEVENLINIACVKYLGLPFNVKEIVVRKSCVSLVFDDLKDFNNQGLLKAIDEFGKTAYFSLSDKPNVTFARVKDGNAQMLEVVKRFLTIANDSL